MALGSFWLQGPHPPLLFKSQLPSAHPYRVSLGLRWRKYEERMVEEGRIDEACMCLWGAGVRGDPGMLRRVSKALLSNRTFCSC